MQEIMESFGEFLREKRRERGMSQRELAQKAGIHYSYLSRLENGERLPNKQICQRLADALGLSNEEREKLLSLAFVKSEKEILVRDFYKVLDSFEGLDGREREAFYTLLQRQLGLWSSLIQLSQAGSTKKIRSGKTKVVTNSIKLDSEIEQGIKDEEITIKDKIEKQENKILSKVLQIQNGVSETYEGQLFSTGT